VGLAVPARLGQRLSPRLNSEKDYYYFLRDKLQTNELSPQAVEEFRQAVKPVWQSYVDDGFFSWDDINQAMAIAKQ
jgi:hypothetical protein